MFPIQDFRPYDSSYLVFWVNCRLKAGSVLKCRVVSGSASNPLSFISLLPQPIRKRPLLGIRIGRLRNSIIILNLAKYCENKIIEFRKILANILAKIMKYFLNCITLFLNLWLLVLVHHDVDLGLHLVDRKAHGALHTLPPVQDQ